MGTFLVLCVLGVICFFAVKSLIADKKAGRCSGCSQGCSGCSQGCSRMVRDDRNAKKPAGTHRL